MKRIIVGTALLLATAVTAQAAPQQAPYHSAYRPVAGDSAGVLDRAAASMPPGFRAVFDDAINAVQRGSAHPAAHDRACMARQSQLADDIERLVPGGPVDVRQNPAMIELRTRCMPVNPNPPEYW